MTDGRGSITAPVALAAVVLAAVAVVLVGAAATGAIPGMAGDDQPDGETVLDRAEQRYATADTLVGDATVTVANGTAERSVNVSYVLARPDRVRVGVEDRYLVGTNGSVAWVSADGVVLSTPVPDANWSAATAGRSAAANRTEALADRWRGLNRSTLVERVLTLVELNGPGSGLPATDSGLPANWSERVPAAGDLPANWTANDVPANWSERIPANWSERISTNWSERIPTNWSERIPANWSERIPANWSERIPANWSEQTHHNWSQQVAANASIGSVPANWSERARAAWANRTNGWENSTSEWTNRTDSWTENASAYAGERNYTTELVGTETVEGRETYVLSVDRANATTPWNATLWVDTEDYRLHRAAVTAREYRVTVDFDTTINASVRDSTFRPPDDSGLALAGRNTYDSFDAAQANTSLDLGRLDDGYTFENATVATQAGVTVAVQQYTDGERSVALVETTGRLPFGVGEGEAVTVDGASATYVERDGRSAVVWERDGTTRAVLADLPRGDLVALAESASA